MLNAKTGHIESLSINSRQHHGEIHWSTDGTAPIHVAMLPRDRKKALRDR
ncbi:MAG: hypothetical protein AAGM36_18960 [Cyanobacteria bacterium J06597_1]